MGSGCASGEYRRLFAEDEPPLEVLSIAARFPTETSGVMELRLGVPNRGDERLILTGLTWEIFLEERSFSQGIQTTTFEVGPREERTYYVTVPLAFRRMPLRRGPIRLEIGLRGKASVLYGDSTEPRLIPFSRRMEVLCENAPIFPLPGKLQEGQ
jgi:hypothetical protein